MDFEMEDGISGATKQRSHQGFRILEHEVR
jgi:hypothetical protein